MKRFGWLAFVFGIFGSALGCSDAEVAGDYANAQVTNRTDGCSIGWETGKNTTASAVVTQSGSDVSLRVEGIEGAALFAVLLGTNVFAGKVSGDDVDLKVTGTISKSQGNCTYTYNARLQATLDGDALQGSIEYKAATNGGSDCGTRNDCVSRQDFAATRPPE